MEEGQFYNVGIYFLSASSTKGFRFGRGAIGCNSVFCWEITLDMEYVQF